MDDIKIWPARARPTDKAFRKLSLVGDEYLPLMSRMLPTKINVPKNWKTAADLSRVLVVSHARVSPSS